MAACPCLTHSDMGKLVARRNKHVRELEADMCEFLVKGFRRARHGRIMKQLRPTTRISKFEMARLWEGKDPRGEPVDAISYHCNRITELNREICGLRTHLAMDQRPSAALIVFNRQEAAHEACKSSLETQWFRRGLPPTYWPRFSDIDPGEINWPGLTVPMRAKRINKVLSRAFVLGVISVWIFPVVFISAVAKMDRLENFGPFKDISNWPTQLAGLVQGVFPPLILGILQRMIPGLFRRAIAIEGIPTTRHMELTLLNYMFLFEITDAFVIPCVASTIFGSYDTFLHDPFAAARTIIKEIPTVSTFFMAYVLMQALANAGMELARVLRIIDYKFTAWFSRRSPRIMLQHKMPSKFRYAEAIPTHSLMFLLGLIYSAVAPLMTVATTLYFVLFAFVYKYKFMYVYDDRSFRLGGQISVKLLAHRWMCLYAAEALFFLVIVMRVSVHKTKASGMQLTMVISTIMITFYFNYIIKTRIYPRLIYIDDHPEETADVRLRLGRATPAPEPELADSQTTAMGFREYALPREIERACSDPCLKITVTEHDGSPEPPMFNEIGQEIRSQASLIPTRPDPAVSQLFAESAPFPYEAWRIDARPEIATVGPGVPVRSELFDDPTVLWPKHVTDPGFSHVWLPALPAQMCPPRQPSDATLNGAADIRMASRSPQPRQVAIARARAGGMLGMPLGQMLSASSLADLLARRQPLAPTPSIRGGDSGSSFSDSNDSVGTWEEVAESLYEEIGWRLGVYGDVVTRFAAFDEDGRDFGVSAAGYPENPTMRPLQRVIHFE
ncbi:phosphate metabolism protein 7 [Linderina pennispora]|nr:phosphate metabolism protein 7 [Linderina pennispora]